MPRNSHRRNTREQQMLQAKLNRYIAKLRRVLAEMAKPSEETEADREVILARGAELMEKEFAAILRSLLVWGQNAKDLLTNELEKALRRNRSRILTNKFRRDIEAIGDLFDSVMDILEDGITHHYADAYRDLAECLRKPAPKEKPPRKKK